MSLDLVQIAGQIQGMAENLKVKEEERRDKLRFALGILHSIATEFDQLKHRIEAGKTTWLVAGLKEKLDLRRPTIPCPEDFIVLASDGSHIDVDRHHSTHCFLINIGLVQLQYGQNPEARLSASPLLYFKNNELIISSSDGRQVPIEGQLLGLKRTIEESRLLAEKVGEMEGDLPVVVLLDGSLILWGMIGQVYQDFVIHELLENGFLNYLNRIREISDTRQLALASYISFPRSTEVVNALRLAICPHQTVNCDYYCNGKVEERGCEAVAGLVDRDIFNQLLSQGERSAVFSSRSTIVEKYYGDHEINFFYIKVDDEIARVEIPVWVADDAKLINLVHAVIVDQCRRGLGYPVALSEAHERAVVTTVDREHFWRLVEQILAEDKIWLTSSAKQQSKRTRWI